MKPKVVILIGLSTLEKLSTPRILSYLKKLQQSEENFGLSDWSIEGVLSVDGIVFKSGCEWILQYIST